MNTNNSNSDRNGNSHRSSSGNNRNDNNSGVNCADKSDTIKPDSSKMNDSSGSSVSNILINPSASTNKKSCSNKFSMDTNPNNNSTL